MGLRAADRDGSFACQLAFFNTSNRYFFSMGRGASCRCVIGRTHPKHHSPYIAAIVTTTWAGAIMLGFELYDDSTIAALFQLGTWVPLMGMFGILIIQCLVSASIIYYFWAKARDGMQLVQDDHRADPGRGRLPLRGLPAE